MVNHRSPKPGLQVQFLPLLQVGMTSYGVYIGMWSNIRKFFSEVRAEMQKVTWSSRDEIVGSTAVVLMTMLILSTFIGISDFILAHALSVLLR